jgi:hypothetical protein
MSLTKQVYDRSLIVNDYKNGLSLHDLHRKYGISTSFAYYIICLAKCGRSISEAHLLKSTGELEWRKLVPIRSGRKHPRTKFCSTRLLSLPTRFIVALGLNPNDELIGKWQVEKGKLRLSIKARTR